MLLIKTTASQYLLLLALPMIGCCLLSKRWRTEPMLKLQAVLPEGRVAETVYEESKCYMISNFGLASNGEKTLLMRPSTASLFTIIVLRP